MSFINRNILEKRKWYQNPITLSFSKKIEQSASLLEESLKASTNEHSSEAGVDDALQMEKQFEDELTKLYLSGLLEAKGLYSSEEQYAYLAPLEQELLDPFLFKEMHLVCELISESINKNEKIMVFGDYDCDGLTATAIVVRVLRKLNADVEYIIPDRIDDGYGLGETTVERILEIDPDLLITVDCGINNRNEIIQLMTAGIKVIVTDHHQPDSEFTRCSLAVINPQLPNSGYPFTGLSGAGVALKLVQALLIYVNKEQDIDLSAELCLAAVGTVADSMPLESENRIIVALATSIFLEKAPAGLITMAKSINNSNKLEASFFAFSIGPRLNAAGRMGKIEPAISLLLSEDENEIASNLAELEELNNQRKALEQQIFSEAVDQIDEMPLEARKHIIVVANEKWHTGIVGIVSSRLVDKYSVPVITFAGTSDGLQGSARSIGDFDILSAIDSASGYTETFGGHIQAAGVTIKPEHLVDFRQQITDYAMANPVKKSELENLQYQYVLPHKIVNDELATKLILFEPYGQKNEKPSFVLENVTIEQWRTVGQGKHVSLSLRLDDDRLVSGIGFNAQEFSRLFRQNDKADLLVNINRHEWNGRCSTQLQILDWRVPYSSNLLWQDIARVEESYQINGQNISELISMYGINKTQFEISNQQIMAVTRYIQQYSSQLERGFNLTLLARAIARELKTVLNPFILTRVFYMLKEIDLIECESIDTNNYILKMKPQDGIRKNIQDSNTWQILNKQGLMIDVGR